MIRKLASVIGLATMLSSFAVIQASAADDGYNPPPSVATVCDAGHGAFGAFSHHFASYGGVNWISADAREDGGLGHDTGPVNSGLGQACNPSIP